VQLVVYARRFFCDNPDCCRRIFSEPFPEVLPRYARHTERLRVVLLELVHASGAEMAARVAKLLGLPTSPDSLIRRQRQEEFPIPSPRALGMDEFSLRRGSTFATLLVDLERHRPVDVVEDRRAEPVADWLRAHPGIEVVARDRAGAYALAAATGAPQAVQVADRFHLVRNVGDAVKELVRSRRWNRPIPAAEAATSSQAEQASVPAASMAPPNQEPQPTPTKQARWEAVQQQKAKGRSLKAIARELGINRKTVRKYLALDRPPVYPQRRPRPTRLTSYLPYLRQRWHEGCHNVRRLYREIVGQGFNGTERQVRRVLHPWRSTRIPSSPERPSPLHWLLLCPSSKLTSSQHMELEVTLQANPPLALAYRLKEQFHQVVAHRDIDALDGWLTEAAQSDLPTFKTVARTFRRDYQAIKAALTLPWSTAQCEGHNTRVKLIKRLGYGRAKLDLLRKRIVHRMATA
jgi:transposase